MKIFGIILLVIGILSLIGGLVSPSGETTGIVVGGYVLKLALIIGGILLINKSNKDG